MVAYGVKRGMVICIPGYEGTYEGLEVANVKPGRFKSSLHISFKGGYDCQVDRNANVYEYPTDDECESCEKKDEYLRYYDNGIYGHSGWLCSECIATAEMEL